MRVRLLSVLVALVVAVTASAGVTTVLSNVSAASGSSGEIDTSGAYSLNVQLCGTGFTGTVTVYQGAASGKLVATKTLTLTSYGTCAEYYSLDPSTLVKVDYTRTAGSLTAYLEYYR
jgi:hypothetical protein